MGAYDETAIITRAEYDRLIDTFPAFMASVWPLLPKVWCLRGAVIHYGIHARLIGRLIHELP